MAKKPFDPEKHAYKVLRKEFSQPDWIPRIQAYNRASRAFGLKECAKCLRHVLKKDTHLDHIVPFIPIEGTDDSLKKIAHRLYCQADGLQVLCIQCHIKKTVAENKERAQIRRQRKASS